MSFMSKKENQLGAFVVFLGTFLMMGLIYFLVLMTDPQNSFSFLWVIIFTVVATVFAVLGELAGGCSD